MSVYDTRSSEPPCLVRGSCVNTGLEQAENRLAGQAAGLVAKVGPAVVGSARSDPVADRTVRLEPMRQTLAQAASLVEADDHRVCRRCGRGSSSNSVSASCPVPAARPDSGCGRPRRESVARPALPRRPRLPRSAAGQPGRGRCRARPVRPSSRRHQRPDERRRTRPPRGGSGGPSGLASRASRTRPAGRNPAGSESPGAAAGP